MGIKGKQFLCSGITEKELKGISEIFGGTHLTTGPDLFRAELFPETPEVWTDLRIFSPYIQPAKHSVATAMVQTGPAVAHAGSRPW
jgi:hypothetical protein